MQAKPNILLILNDDMGFSDIGCYGGEIETPNLDRLAYGGLRFSQFYNSPRCSPSRASLLTGLHPHQTGIGILTYPTGPEGYAGNLNRRCVTIAEALKPDGYRCYMSGKWHVASSLDEPSDAWPMQRGFDEFYGTIIGAGSFYHPNTLTRGNENVDHEAERDEDFFYTDAVSDEAARQIRSHQAHHPDAPFFQYVAYTAPHWPLHAHEEDIARYKGRFDAGWDELRESRLSRMVDMGIIDPAWKLTGRDPSQPPWEDAPHKEWLLRCMEVYAAQVDRMDQGIGRILQALEDTGRIDDTLVIFLSDNGACAEDIPERHGRADGRRADACAFPHPRRRGGRLRQHSGPDANRIRAPGFGRGPRPALRRVGRALRRDPAGQGAGDDAPPAGQGVLGGRPGLGDSGARAVRGQSGLIGPRLQHAREHHEPLRVPRRALTQAHCPFPDRTLRPTRRRISRLSSDVHRRIGSAEPSDAARIVRIGTNERMPLETVTDFEQGHPARDLPSPALPCAQFLIARYDSALVPAGAYR